MKHMTNMTCKICKEELSTGYSRFRIINWFKKKRLIKEHLKTHSEQDIIMAGVVDYILKGRSVKTKPIK